jgi:predicted ferric reductase
MLQTHSIQLSVRTRKFISLCLLTLSLITPLLLWLFAGPPVRITSTTAFFGAVGQVCAIVGVVLFALQFILAARYKIVESLLHGLNRVYVIHHLLGGFAFILVLFHPISFFIQYALFAFQFLFPPFTQTGIWLGLTAISLLIILLVITYFTKLKYETWKFTHQFLGISFILAFAHTLLVPSTLSVNQPLKFYLIGVYLLGTYSFLYYKLFRPLLVKKHSYVVTKIIQHPDSIHEIILSPEAERLIYDPGQFAFVTFRSKNVIKQTHPFSFTSNPSNPTISFAIKAVGDFTSTIGALKPGDQAQIEGPYGTFTQKNIANNKQIWIAGGIGITPFLSFIRSFPNNTKKQFKNVHLFYSINTLLVPFESELKQAAQKYKWFTYTIHNSVKSGRLTIESITKTTPKAVHYDILLCGPLPMMKSLQKQAKNFGFLTSHLHSEEFRLYS